MNVSIYLQTVYENKRDWTLGQNKPNSNPIQTQNKPNQTQFAGYPNERKFSINKGL